MLGSCMVWFEEQHLLPKLVRPYSAVVEKPDTAWFAHRQAGSDSEGAGAGVHWRRLEPETHLKE
jgi:hypothetical protein